MQLGQKSDLKKRGRHMAHHDQICDKKYTFRPKSICQLYRNHTLYHVSGLCIATKDDSVQSTDEIPVGAARFMDSPFKPTCKNTLEEQKDKFTHLF